MPQTENIESLTSLEKALSDLLTGKSVTQVRTSSGKMVTYAQANIEKLEARINAIKAKSFVRRSRTQTITTSKGL